MSYKVSQRRKINVYLMLALLFFGAAVACDLPFSSSEPTAAVEPSTQVETTAPLPEATEEDLMSSVEDQVGYFETSGGMIKNLRVEVLEEETLGRILKVTLTNDAEPQTRMYWTDSGTDKIQRAFVGSSDIQDLVTEDLLEPNGIALDIRNLKMVWTDGESGKIQRANLDGTLLEDLFMEAGKRPLGVTVALDKDTLFWTEIYVSTLSRSRLDGTDVESPLLSFMNTPHGVAYDPDLQKVFWAESIALRKSDANGGNLENVLTGLNEIRAIAVDPIQREVYWTESGKIRRVGYDGTNPEDLVTTLEGPSLGLALDLREGKMYWTEYDAGRIMRANLDGSDIEEVIVGLENPSGIALEFVGDVFVRIPCGTVFEPSDDGEDSPQRLMVIQEASTLVPAGGQAELYPYVICIDSNRGLPGRSTEYQIKAPVSGDLYKLADCICDENLVSEEEDPMLNMGQQAGLQLSVWQVSGGLDFDELMAEAESAGAGDSALGSYSELIQMSQEIFSTLPQYVDWLEMCQIELPE
jgi:low density lipoprotein receptor-related protein 5/6